MNGKQLQIRNRFIHTCALMKAFLKKKERKTQLCVLCGKKK